VTFIATSARCYRPGTARRGTTEITCWTTASGVSHKLALWVLDPSVA
jgi:hypothetical protein